MYDFKGRPKKSGGDFLLTRLHSPELVAGVAGKVVDYLNGSYSAVFPLLWGGSAQVEVRLQSYICIVYMYVLVIKLTISSVQLINYCCCPFSCSTCEPYKRKISTFAS